MSQPTGDDLGERVAALEDVVASIADLLAARRGGGPWWWEGLDQEQAGRLWDDLAEFVAYLSRRYLAQLPAEYAVPPCWYRHPVAVELLTALMVAHVGAYRDAGAEPGPALVDFHERSLWPTLERLRSLRVFASCHEGHTERRATSRVAVEPDDGYAAYVTSSLNGQETAR